MRIQSRVVCETLQLSNFILPFQPSVKRWLLVRRNLVECHLQNCTPRDTAHSNTTFPLLSIQMKLAQLCFQLVYLNWILLCPFYVKMESEQIDDPNLSL